MEKIPDNMVLWTYTAPPVMFSLSGKSTVKSGVAMFELVKTKWGNIAQGDRVLLPSQDGNNRPQLWQVTRFTPHTVPGVCEGENFLYVYHLENLMHEDGENFLQVTVDIDRYYVQVVRNNG